MVAAGSARHIWRTATKAKPRAIAALRSLLDAGVWVIAETTDLPTKYMKIVVADDQGRYLIPGLPRATYQVWVRGYGLVDSESVDSTPGKRINLKAVVAPTPQEAAKYYPASTEALGRGRNS